MSRNTKIVINERCTIEADEHNWAVHYHPEKLTVTVSTDKQGRERQKYNGTARYMDSIEGALKKFADLELRYQGEVSNLFDLINRVKKLKSEINTLIEGKVAI